VLTSFKYKEICKAPVTAVAKALAVKEKTAPEKRETVRLVWFD
jgi:hypothetical protein